MENAGENLDATVDYFKKMYVCGSCGKAEDQKFQDFHNKVGILYITTEWWSQENQ